MGLFDAFLPSFLLAYDVGRLWPLKLRYVINLRAAADVAAPKRVLLPHEHDKWLQSREMLKRYLFQGRLWPVRLNVWRLRDVLMEPGDWDILGLHRDEILTRERVTARWELRSPKQWFCLSSPWFNLTILSQVQETGKGNSPRPSERGHWAVPEATDGLQKSLKEYWGILLKKMNF